MRTYFTLTAAIAGISRAVTVVGDGRRYVIRANDGEFVVGSFRRALNETRERLGRFLASAEHSHTTWSLTLEIDDKLAFYGTAPPVLAPVRRSPLPPDDLVAQIRREWPVDGGPLAALANALKICERYYRGETRRAA